MGHNYQPELQLLHNDARLADLFQVLDEIHTAASDGQLDVVTPLSNRELLGWLRDLAYTAQEAITEIESHPKAEPVSYLRLVK